MAFGVTGRDSLNLFYVRLLPVEIVSPSLNEFSPPPANGDPLEIFVAFLCKVDEKIYWESCLAEPSSILARI